MWTTDAFTHFKMVERFKGPYLLRQKKNDKCCPSGSIERSPLRTWTRSPKDSIPTHKFWSLPHL